MRNLVLITDLAKELNIDKSNIPKQLRKLGIEIHTIRGGGNQPASAITRLGAKQFKQYRKDFKLSAKKAPKEGGYFYVILPFSSFPKRVKLGFAEDVDARIKDYKTLCPDLVVLGTWECKKRWEFAVIEQAVTAKDKKQSAEVFDVSDVKKMLDRINLIFSMFKE